MDKEKEKVTTNTETMTTRETTTTGIKTVSLSANGMAAIKTIFRPGLPRETVCHLDWKNNLWSAARFRRDSKKRFNLAR